MQVIGENVLMVKQDDLSPSYYQTIFYLVHFTVGVCPNPVLHKEGLCKPDAQLFVFLLLLQTVNQTDAVPYANCLTLQW